MNDRLRQLQLRFKAYLQQDDPAIHEDIVGSDQAQAEHRLAAYWNAYRLRLLEALGNDYEKLRQFAGDEHFEKLILDYIAENPSRHRSIRWVGQHLPAFLKERNEEVLAELAEFEWSLGLCFDAPEAEGQAGLEDMAIISPEEWPGLRLSFDPSLRWVDPWWNVVPLWQALEAGEEPPRPVRGDFPIRWLLWRRDLDLHWRSLEADEAWAIEAAVKGSNFAELCEGLLEWHGEDQVAVQAAGFLKQWLHDGLVSELLRV